MDGQATSTFCLVHVRPWLVDVQYKSILLTDVHSNLGRASKTGSGHWFTCGELAPDVTVITGTYPNSLCLRHVATSGPIIRGPLVPIKPPPWLSLRQLPFLSSLL
jgi:hypothetical protein